MHPRLMLAFHKTPCLTHRAFWYIWQCLFHTDKNSRKPNVIWIGTRNQLQELERSLADRRDHLLQDRTDAVGSSVTRHLDTYSPWTRNGLSILKKKVQRRIFCPKQLIGHSYCNAYQSLVNRQGSHSHPSCPWLLQFVYAGNSGFPWAAGAGLMDKLPRIFFLPWSPKVWLFSLYWFPHL